MKTPVFTLITLGLLTSGVFTDAFANPRTKKQSKAKPIAPVEQQLANHLTYPQALQQTKGNGVVVIQFRLNQNDRVTDVTVFSADEALNHELSKQLTNVKLAPAQSAEASQVYTAQLRFRAEE